MLTEEEILKKLKDELSNWSYDKDSNYIKREIRTKNFKETMLILGLIGGLSESHFHHPDVEFGYNRILIKLKTHSQKSITQKDIDLAKDIEKHITAILEREEKK